MQPHGYIDFIWQGNILYAHPQGPFNEEGAEKAITECLSSIRKKDLSQFSMIEIWDNETMGSPETLEIARAFWHKLTELNCRTIAVVAINTLQHGIAEKYLPSFGRVFNDIESAQLWTKSRL